MPLMFYLVDFMRPRVYKWCTSLLAKMKRQLVECKQGSKRNFGFSSICCIILFEHILGLGPRVYIILCGPRDPSMAWWTEVMRWQGGGRVPTPYNNDFLFWWRQQVISLDDYPYTGINFRGYPGMPLPPGSTYRDIGMSNFF
jgi:hypothetical protein